MKQMMLTRRKLLQTSGVATLSALCRPLFAERKHYDVIIIGAGLAGLRAGQLLRQRGVDFLLLEGSQRVGGRIYTLDDLPGKPEAGASQSGTNYQAFNEALATTGIKTMNPRPGAPGMTLLVNGQLSAQEDWANSPGNLLPEDLRATPPYRLLPQLLRKGRFLSEPLDWWNPENNTLDIPLQTYLRQLGADDEAIRLIAANLNGESIATLSTLDLLRKLAVLQAAGAPQSIEGGFQRVPNALHAQLGAAVMLGKQVTGINATSSKVQLATADGDRFSCRVCLVAVPFSVLRELKIDARLSDAKQQAIKRMGYTPVSHVLMKPKEPFWLADKLSPNMWTDTALGRLFAQTDEAGTVLRVRAWTQGPAAQELAGMTDAELGSHVVARLEQARPLAKSKLEVERVISWGNNPFARGAFSHYLAGGAHQFSRAVSQPEGLLHFIGAHTEPSASGMEAAARSGARGAKEALQRLT